MDIEFKKLLAGDLWAESGDRVDMDDSSVQPVIDRSQGYSVDFSTSTTPARARINQILRELYGAAKEVRMGVSPYDAEVDYPVGAITQVNGDLFYALVAHSSATPVNPLDTGQTAWATIGGRSALDRSEPAVISNANIFIDGDQANKFSVWWYAPDNGGYEILQTSLQYSKDSAFPSNETTTIDTYTPGADVPISTRDSDLYYVRLRSRNTHGWSAYSAGKKVRSSPLLPDAINTTTSQPEGTGGHAIVRWLKPETNGLTVSQYRIQWRESSESFSTTERNMLVNSTAFSNTQLISGLSVNNVTNIRVTAISNRGTETTTGNEVGVIAVNTRTPPGTPVISTAVDSATEVRAWLSGLLDEGGSSIDYYEWSYQNTGDTGWTTLPNTTSTAIQFTRDRGDTSQVRLRAHSLRGWGPYSSTASAGLFSPSAPDAPVISAAPSFTVVPNAVKGIVSFSMGNMTSPEVVKDRIVQTAIRWKLSSDTQWKTEQSASFPSVSDNRFGIPQVFPASGDLSLGVPIDVQAQWRNAGGWSDWTATNVIPSIVPPSATLVVDTSDITMKEGQTRNIDVKLSRTPVETVTVTMTSSNTDVTISPASLTFGQSNWDVYKQFTITALQDVDEVDDNATLTIAATGGLTIPSKTIDVDIEEALDLIISGDITTTEGSTSQIIVAASRQPPENVTIEVDDISNDDRFGVQPSSRTITPANWKTAQSFSVNSSQILDGASISTDIDFDVSGAITDNFTRRVTAIEIVPTNDKVFIQKDSVVRAIIGQSNPARIRLSRAPRSTATIDISPMRSFLSVDKTQMVFTRTNWNVYQTLNITPSVDAPLNATDYIMITPRQTYEVAPDFLQVMTTSSIILDDSYTVGENNFLETNVRLASQPSSDVTLTLTHGNELSSLTVHPSKTLTFTSANWNTNQTVRIIGPTISGSIISTITWTATGGLTGSRTIPLTVLENTNILSISEPNNLIRITIGTPKVFQVSLLNAPLENVVFPSQPIPLPGGFTNDIPGGVTITPVTLTPTNYTNVNVTANATSTHTFSNGRLYAKGVGTNSPVSIRGIDFAVNSTNP